MRMVIIMPAFAEGEQRNDHIVAEQAGKAAAYR